MWGKKFAECQHTQTHVNQIEAKQEKIIRKTNHRRLLFGSSFLLSHAKAVFKVDEKKNSETFNKPWQNDQRQLLI